MQNWNVIITVLPGPGQENRLLQGLRPLGEFHRSSFKDVCVGRVEDANRFLDTLLQAREAGAGWIAALGRAIPVEQNFRFTSDTLAEQFKQAAEPLLQRMDRGSSFHVRLERRGLTGKIDTPRVEREVAEYLFALAERQHKQLRVSFDDPDYVVAAETVGDECGVTLLTRELSRRYPFVQTR